MTKKQRRKVISNRVPVKHPFVLDRLAAWLGRRSRLTRSLICGMLALALMAALAFVLFGSLLNANPDRLTFGPLNADNLPLLLFAFLVIAGIAFYWVGWRIMIGFDFDEASLQPGRPAALWVLIGIAVFALMLVAGSISALLASQN